MKRLLILFFLASCALPNSNISSNNTVLDFNNDLSFENFKELLIEYTRISPYPNIDK